MQKMLEPEFLCEFSDYCVIIKYNPIKGGCGLMEISTRYFGKINYSDKDVISFSSGIPGFEELKKFILIDVDNIEYLTCLQSLEDENICFFMVPPATIVGNYNIDVKDGVITEIGLNNQEDAEVYTILNIKDNPLETTANLKCPIIINSSTHKGVQGILEDSSYQFSESINKYMH